MPVKRINATYANLRPEPSTARPPIARLPAGLGVEVLGASPDGGWNECKAVVEGHRLQGWVSGRLLRDSLGDAVDRLIEATGHEYSHFDYGRIEESADHGCERIKTYWARLGMDESCTKVPWSAAFISFLVSQANLGLKFAFSQRHTTYLSDSKRHRNDSGHAYGCFPLGHQAVKIGDMVGEYRTGGDCGSAVRSYESLPGDFCAHVNLVVAITGNKAFGIGGNLSNSVGEVEYALDAAGRIKPGGKRIALMCRTF